MATVEVEVMVEVGVIMVASIGGGKLYAVPNDIQAMGPYMKEVLDYISSLDLAFIEQANLGNQYSAIVSLANQFAAEFQLYQDMLKSDDPGYRGQETRLRSFYSNFKNRYERFVQAVENGSSPAKDGGTPYNP